jgi:hypothetical protein
MIDWRRRTHDMRGMAMYRWRDGLHAEAHYSGRQRRQTRLRVTMQTPCR